MNCNGDTGICEKQEITQVDGPFVTEPFCLLWSQAESSTSIDTIAFAPATAWPPVVLIPKLVTAVPFCGVKGFFAPCTFCDFHRGWPLTNDLIGSTVYKRNIQFSGVALSWADKGKLAFGTTKSTKDLKIWDGFLNVDLPEVSDFNFWVSFRLSLVPLPGTCLSSLCCLLLHPSLC